MLPAAHILDIASHLGKAARQHGSRAARQQGSKAARQHKGMATRQPGGAMIPQGREAPEEPINDTTASKSFTRFGIRQHGTLHSTSHSSTRQGDKHHAECTSMRAGKQTPYHCCTSDWNFNHNA